MAYDYETLRDDTTTRLIEKFGKPTVIRRKVNRTFDPALGKFSADAPADGDPPLPSYVEYPCSIVRIGAVAVLKGTGEYREGMVLKWNEGLLVSATGLAAAGVEPDPADTVVYNGREVPIVRIVKIAPGDVAVAYKFGVTIK